jgi:ATP-dependent RNA circularization protein (DNA/RNA ligase family)
VEEKLDGANLGLSIGPDGELLAQNRGQYLPSPYNGQFTRLFGWLQQHEALLHEALGPDLTLFGEWCAARHSLDYSCLPDWFLAFDVYDRVSRRFWSSPRRDALAKKVGLITVPQVFHGKTSLAALNQLVATASSKFRQGSLEGLVIRSESPEWVESRAKLVRTDFIQEIESHWRKRTIEWNRMDYSASGPR